MEGGGEGSSLLDITGGVDAERHRLAVGPLGGRVRDLGVEHEHHGEGGTDDQGGEDGEGGQFLLCGGLGVGFPLHNFSSLKFGVQTFHLLVYTKLMFCQVIFHIEGVFYVITCKITTFWDDLFIDCLYRLSLFKYLNYIRTFGYSTKKFIIGR